MKITTLPTADFGKSTLFTNKVVVVIDVLRATSTMITALSFGAKQIVPVIEIEAAKTFKQTHQDKDLWLCGERSAGLIPGFDKGNSPFEYMDPTTQQKTLVVSTTNGTKAIQNGKDAKKLYLASFINANAIVNQVQNSEELLLYCAGTHGQFSMDDAFCSAYIVELLKHKYTLDMCDLTQSLQWAWEQSKEDYVVKIKNCLHGQLLIKKGFEKDIDYCLQQNITNVVPQYHKKANWIKA